MIIEDKITISNYKCFDEEGGGFDRILPINILIGKNNSGKSSLLDLIHWLTTNKPFQKFNEVCRGNYLPQITIEHILTKEDIPTGSETSDITIRNGASTYQMDGRGLVGASCTYKIIGEKTHSVELKSKSYDIPKGEINGFIKEIKKEKKLGSKSFCHLTAERDVVSEKETNILSFNSNGSGVTNYISQIINKAKYNRSLIESTLLNKINEIINPDIHFSRILVRQDDNDFWEIFFEDIHGTLIALSKMGSGIKTVLLVLLNLYVRPKIDSTEEKMYTFAFEELENNLHPSIQRKLYSHIKEYSEKHSAYFFITTHSNIVIDAFGTYENAQFIHVQNDGKKSTTTTILAQNTIKNILKDLDIKASDLLQSNGIIWVEGPSDRNYINRWLEIEAPQFQEGLHYSILFYGGRLLANHCFDDWVNKELVPLLKVNTNAFVVMDSDCKDEDSDINETKKRISQEIGDNNYWITAGREIENYLSDSCVSEWLAKDHSCEVNYINPQHHKIEDSIKVCGNEKIKYSAKKTYYSNEIKKYITKENMTAFDLKEKMQLLIAAIGEWNNPHAK